MKKLGIVLTTAAVMALVAGPALAAKKKAPPKKLSQGFMEELSKAKWTWQAPKKGKKKK